MRALCSCHLRHIGLLANLWDFPNLEIPATSLAPPATPESSTKATKIKMSPAESDPPISPYTLRKQLMDTYLESIGLSFIASEVQDRKDAGTCMHLFSHVKRKMLVEGFVVSEDLGDTPSHRVKTGKQAKGPPEVHTAGGARREWKWLTEDELLGTRAVVGVPATLKKALAVYQSKGKQWKGGVKRKSPGDDDEDGDKDWGEKSGKRVCSVLPFTRLWSRSGNMT